MEFKMVKVSDIETNDYNPNVMSAEDFEDMKSILAEEGMVQPLLVRPNPEGDPPYILVDGEHRLRASQQIGLDEVMVVEMEYDEDTAMMRTLSMNNHSEAGPDHRRSPATLR
jgi:ParB family chromosome partitioning protein